MSDLNTAFLTDDLDSDSETTVGSAVNTADTVTPDKATADCKNLHEQDCIVVMTAYSLSEPSLKRENVGRECVWDTIPITSVNSNAPERKLTHDESQEMEIVAVKPLNHVTQSTDVNSKKETRASNKRKKSKHCRAGNLNLGHSSDSCVLVDKSTLQARDEKASDSVCNDTYPISECVENVADRMSELSAAFKNNCAEDLSVETCHAVPKKSVKKWKVQHDGSRESGLIVKPLNHLTQNTDAKITNRTRIRNKRKQKSLHSLALGMNLGHRSDSCLPVEQSVLPAHDSNSSTLPCSDTYPIKECVENMVESMSELSAGLKSNSYVEEMITDACNDTDVGANLPQTAAQSVSVCQDEDGLPNASAIPGNFDEYKNTLNVDIFFCKDGPEKAESSASNTAMYCPDTLAPSSRNTVQSTTNNNIEFSLRERLLATSDENVSTFQQQRKKNKRRSCQLAEAAISKPVEQQNGGHVCNVPDGLSAVEQCEGCSRTTSMQLQEQDAGCENQCAEIMKEMPNVNTAQCLSRISADMLISNQCLFEDDFNDTETFPVFTRQSSRRLRRTSIQLYRKSLQDAENVAMEEECSALPVSTDTENETAVARTEMLLTNNDVFCNEFACQTTEPSSALTLPAAIMEKVDMQSDDVQTVQLPSVSTSTELKPRTDSHVTNVTSNRPQRRCTANSQSSLNVPISLPARTRKRKPSTTVEDIYLNRLWRSQMPKEKALEIIPESTTLELYGRKVTKRVCVSKFDDAPSKTKLRQRRQKAVKNGWKPLTKKQHALLDRQLDAKLAEIDKDLV